MRCSTSFSKVTGPLRLAVVATLAAVCGVRPARAQLTDVTQTPNAIDSGIRKSLASQIGAGRGDELTLDTSLFTIRRDPFRAIARGRQLFQRKFTLAQGLGPRSGDGVGDISLHPAVGAGVADSCAACHGRPRGSAGVGGNVYTRPDSRDAPHLFGLGLVEMLADEITHELRAIRGDAVFAAQQLGHDVTRALVAKGIDFGALTAHSDGSLDLSQVSGVDADLRVRPFFAQGKTVSIREFVVGAFGAEMGLQAVDRDLLAASRGHSIVTPAGMVLDGALDVFEAPPATDAGDDADGDGVTNELPSSAIDFVEFYLLNYFPPARGKQTAETERGRLRFDQIGCTQCHVPDLWIEHDRRVADVRTSFDAAQSNGVFNHFFATATPLHATVDDGSGLPPLQPPALQPFLVRNLFADFRRHDLGPAFQERNFDGSLQTLFLTEPLWGVGSTAPYGHDGRSATLEDVILRHGGEAQVARNQFAALPEAQQRELVAFLQTLLLFGPPDTASNLDPADPLAPNFPLAGHGSIDLSVLFVHPGDKE